jgi:UDP-glucose 4-epimerase
MRTCVTGGAGFLGSHLVDRLLTQSAEVLVLDNLSSGLKNNINPRAAFVPLDIARAQIHEITACLRGVKSVWHFSGNRVLAADSRTHLEQNAIATVKLLQAAAEARVEKFFLCSSGAVYGRGTKAPTEKEAPRPASTYGASKLSAEGFLSAYCAQAGIAAAIFRIGTVVGSRERGGIISEILKQEGELLHFPAGTGKISCLHVSDCIDAILLASRQAAPGKSEVWNICAPDRVPARKFSEAVGKRAGFLAVSPDGSEKDFPETPFLNTRKIRSLGWQPKLKSIAAAERAASELRPRR